MNDSHSSFFESAINAFKNLPLIGEKTAVRIVFHLMKNKADLEFLQKNLEILKDKVVNCQICNLPSDKEICNICSDAQRDRQTICVITDPIVFVFVERTRLYKGIYFLINELEKKEAQIIPPVENIRKLKKLVDANKVKEIIVATNPTPEGDALIYFIRTNFKKENVKISTISRGIAYGSDITYYDPSILIKAIHERIDVSKIFKGG